MKNGGVHHSEGDALQGLQMIQWHETNEQRDGEHNGNDEDWMCSSSQGGGLHVLQWRNSLAINL